MENHPYPFSSTHPRELPLYLLLPHLLLRQVAAAHNASQQNYSILI
jgi:hypothetical protein